MLRIDATGSVTRGPHTGQSGSLSTLQALAYRARPAVQYARRDTGLDLKGLGVTPEDLEQFGAGIVLNETRDNGDKLLVWTE